MFQAGQEIGPYALIKRIGRGGFGEVWLAERRAKFVTTKVAIKLPLEEQVDTDAIKNEAVLWEQASGHPNVMPIIEADEYDGQIVIVSEYAPDGSLDDFLKRERTLPIRSVVEMAIGILNGLEFLHSKQIIHRDLKPANVLLQGNTPRLTDFGVSRVMKSTGASADMSGTPAYMAPEAFDRKRNAQTDIWSAGAMLYELLSGSRPFPYDSLTGLLGAIVRDPPDHLPDHIPTKLKQIVFKALEKDPAARYQTAKEMRTDLADLLVTIFQQDLETTLPNEQLATTLPNIDQPVTVSPPTNLSQNSASIIGREKEISELRNLMRRDDVRLVTMTGVGGTGKTTLAREAARGLLEEFVDGVFFVDLASISESELVVSNIAQTLGVKESGTKQLLEILQDYLSEKSVLLILDNFEQVNDAAPQIAELLSVSARLKILITSRIPLHISAEREFVALPLTLPNKTAQISIDELSNYEAIKLFIERSRHAKPNFALSEENAGSVAEICNRLDGLPLAIELAAARVKILSPQTILAKLEKSLKLLTGGARDMPARQQTMRGAVGWSHDLLSDNEKRLFRRLAVFAGGFTYEAAESVVSGQWSVAGEEKINSKEAANNNPQQQITDFDVLDKITSLVDKSLLGITEQFDGETRFRMLQVVREYALESLEENGETEAIRRSHAAHFLALAEEAEPHLQGAKSAEWLNRLEDEHDNLRDALSWSLKNDVQTGARLAAAIRVLWLSHNHLTEGRRWLTMVLDESNSDPPSAVRFKLLNGLALAARQQGDYETARKVYEEGLAAGRAVNDLPQTALSGRGLGIVAHLQGDFTAARRFVEVALAISRELDNKSGIASALNILGHLEREEGNSTPAQSLFEESLVISRQLGNKESVSSGLICLGLISYDGDDFLDAGAHFREALTLANELGNKNLISYLLDGFAALAVKRRDLECAAGLSGAAEHLRESISCAIEPAEGRFRDAYVAELGAQMDEAAFSRAYEQGGRMKLDDAIALCLNSI